MSNRRFAARGLMLAMLAYAPACAESTSDDATLDEAVRGDGSDFEEGEGKEFAEAAAEVEGFETAAAEDGPAPTEASLNRNGTHPTRSYTSGFRNGAQFAGATIFYPTDKSDLGGVVMCPGYTAARSSIADWGPFFASHGIVLMIIDTNTALDGVPARAKALQDALVSLKGENTRSGSPLNGKFGGRWGLSGWSMGGGGTWIASVADSSLKSAVTLAGHNATAGGGNVARGSRVPTLMMNGADDTSILGGQNQTQNAYKAIPESTPKLMYIMSGYGHFAWGTPTTNSNASGRYMMAWQKTFLEGDERYKPFLTVKGPRAQTWQTNL